MAIDIQEVRYPPYIDVDGIQRFLGYHLNPNTWLLEANTGGTGVGQDVNITNFPATQPVSNRYDDIVNQYSFSDLDSTTYAPNIYAGFIDAVGNWYILRFNETALTMRYTKGSSGYTTNWTNRNSLTYDYFDVVF